MWLIISVAVLLLFLNIKTPFDDPVKQNCLAMMVFVSLLWCTEALPLFVTSMLLPLLVVVLGVMQDKTVTPPRRLPAMEAAPAVFHAMFSQVSCGPCTLPT
jgi:phosphate transporter